MALGHNIKRIRELKKISVKELSDKIGINPQSIYDWEKEKYEPVKENLESLARILGVQVKTFYDENSTDGNNPSNNKGNQLMTPRETFYTDLIEKNDEYNLIPRAVLKDYKIVPDKIIDVIIQSNENEKKALVEGLNSKYELMIQGYKNKIADLESELKRLRNG